MKEFFTWEVLATFAGASVATVIITQLIKNPLARIPTQIVSYVVALIVLIGATAITGIADDWAEWAIIPLNAILVSLTANGEYCLIKRIKKDKWDKWR